MMALNLVAFWPIIQLLSDSVMAVDAFFFNETGKIIARGPHGQINQLILVRRNSAELARSCQARSFVQLQYK